jgi:LEA14-like dessication related protein
MSMNDMKKRCPCAMIAILSALCLLLITACAVKDRKPDSIKVNLVNIKAQEVKLLETSLIVELRVFNVNDFTLEIKGTECRIDISGNNFAFGVSDEKIEIPAFGTATIPIKVYSSVFDVVKNLISLTDEQKLEYKIVGKLHLEKKSSNLSTISFETAGQLFSREIEK